MGSLPGAARVYVCLVVSLAAVAVTLGPTGPIDPATLACLLVLFVVAESTVTIIGTGRTGISPSLVASLAAVVLVGPVGAAIVGMGCFLVLRRHSIVKRLFNAGQLALAGYAAGNAFLLLGGDLGVPERDGFPSILLPFASAILVFTLVNMVLITILMALLGVIRLERPRRIRWRPLAVLELSSLGFGVLGLSIVAMWDEVGALAVVLVLVPLAIARWAFRQSVAEQRAHDATLATLCQAVETKDRYTRGHCLRVSAASGMIAQELGMDAERVQTVRYAGMLHDVGKLGVPTRLLRKPGKLTDEEFAAIRLHPMRGHEIVREIDFLGDAASGVLYHHERMDGRGYPTGLAGAEIPEIARIVSVADVFDCLTTTRSYRKAWPIEDALAELRRCAGTQFDPVMVDALIRAIREHGWTPPDSTGARPADTRTADTPCPAPWPAEARSRPLPQHPAGARPAADGPPHGPVRPVAQ
ncbi:HD-GYP domain-containing protein [Nocardiopsis sediminis]|uniref:HD-GYP domain-containing protein n=1 Tax=Nocardiopsis sediminis TaxID=1778267 RepID=A0ABV8FMP6_9ACTN